MNQALTDTHRLVGHVLYQRISRYVSPVYLDSVARNFPKVKQEILLTDVTSCFNTLKRAVQDLQTADLQMAQPTVRLVFDGLSKPLHLDSPG